MVGARPWTQGPHFLIQQIHIRARACACVWVPRWWLCCLSICPGTLTGKPWDCGVLVKSVDFWTELRHILGHLGLLPVSGPRTLIPVLHLALVNSGNDSSVRACACVCTCTHTSLYSLLPGLQKHLEPSFFFFFPSSLDKLK